MFPLVGAKINLKTNSGLSFVGTTDEAGSSTFDFSGVTIVGSGAPDLTSAWNEISNNEYSLKLILENDLIQVDDNSGLVYSAQSVLIAFKTMGILRILSGHSNLILLLQDFHLILVELSKFSSLGTIIPNTLSI